jgi:hypothetical protein
MYSLRSGCESRHLTSKVREGGISAATIMLRRECRNPGETVDGFPMLTILEYTDSSSIGIRNLTFTDAAQPQAA